LLSLSIVKPNSYGGEQLNRSLKVTFVMPRTGEWAAGGLRIIYQYANYLSERGHVVTVVHPGRLVVDPKPLDSLKNTVRYLLRKADGKYTPDTWMQMRPEVHLTCVPSLAERYIPDGDIVFATAWQTAEWVTNYSKSKGRGFYLIQHLETWNGPEGRVLATWRAPLQKVVPSKWLADIAKNMGESAIYIPYGLDMDKFYLITPSEARDANQLMMLYHESEWKGCAEGLQALSLVREKNSDMRAIFFGTPARPEALPEWIEYHRSPSPMQLRELYNRASIFVAPSRTEGWGLTGCEALLCGAALVATDIDGHREFAFDGQTALTSPARSPERLAENVNRLLKDPQLRIELAKKGHEFLRTLTWERATNSMERALYSEADSLLELSAHG
jgi:glycosyltransferase involved in cell wall biosynthesis